MTCASLQAATFWLELPPPLWALLAQLTLVGHAFGFQDRPQVPTSDHKQQGLHGNYSPCPWLSSHPMYSMQKAGSFFGVLTGRNSRTLLSCIGGHVGRHLLAGGGGGGGGEFLTLISRDSLPLLHFVVALGGALMILSHDVQGIFGASSGAA